MPKLGSKKLEQVEMPSSTNEDPAYVVVDLNFKADVLIDMETENVREATLDTLSKMIDSWNYTDEEGKIAPVTKENIRKMPGIDFAFLDKYVQTKLEKSMGSTLSSDEKKTSI